MKFRYTILYVENVKESMDFFCRAFGLKTKFLHESQDYGELDTGATSLSFSSVSLMKQLDKNPGQADSQKPVFEIAFETDDVRASLKQALDVGATLVQDVRDQAWGQTTSYVSDPNGYLIEICSPVQVSID